MGVKAATSDQIIDMFSNLDQLKLNTLDCLDPLAYELLFNLQGDSFSTLESIIQEKLEEKRGGDTRFPGKMFIQNKFAQIKVKVWAQKLLQPQKSKGLQYHATKFYGFNKNFINSKMESAERLYGKKISWVYHNENLMTIE